MNKNKDLGIVIPFMTNDSQTNNLIGLAKDYYNSNRYNQVCFFTSYSEIISSKEIPIFHLSHAKFFSGSLLIMDIQSLELCYNFPNIVKILFLISDIPWENDNRNYKEWENLFMLDNLYTIATNEHTYNLLDMCYKKPIYLTERLNYEILQKCLR